MEIARYGRFAVFDRGEPVSPGEVIVDRARFAVIEYDTQGPILRAGPFRDLGIAVDTAQAFNLRDDILAMGGP
jgi:hypothetical protein